MKLSNYAWVALLADVMSYGQGTYGCGQYNSGCQSGGSVLQIGPLILPNTGSTWLILVGIVLVAIGVGVFAWARQRRKKRQP